MGEHSNQKVAGYYNNKDLGVCATNVLLSMIMSSNMLMDILQCKHRCSEASFYEKMDNVRNYMRGRSLYEPPFGICFRDVLLAGVTSVYQNKTYKGKFGVVGDYCVTKASENRRPSEIIPFNKMEPDQSIEDELNQYPSGRIRLDSVLTDLFEVKSVRYPSRLYSYYYYCKLNLLNIEVKTQNIAYNGFEPKPFTPYYFGDLGDDLMEDIANQLSKEKINPELIHLAFAFNANIRIHQLTFDYFVSIISEAERGGYFNETTIDLPVYLYEHLFTVPKIVNDNHIIPFQIGEEDVLYRLQSFSVKMTEEAKLNINDIGEINEDKEELRECLNTFRQKTKMLLQNKNDILGNLIDKFIQKHISAFRSLCDGVVHKGELYEKVQANSHLIHTFAISLINGTWFMMNDNYSFKISNIGDMTELLSDENVDGVLLERINDLSEWENRLGKLGGRLSSSEDDATDSLHDDNSKSSSNSE